MHTLISLHVVKERSPTIRFQTSHSSTAQQPVLPQNLPRPLPRPLPRSVSEVVHYTSVNQIVNVLTKKVNINVTSDVFGIRYHGRSYLWNRRFIPP